MAPRRMSSGITPWDDQLYQGFMTSRKTLGGHFNPYPSTIASVGVILNGSENRVPSLHSANPNK